MSPRYIKSGKISAHRAASLAGDAAAFAHALVALTVAVVGEFSSLLSFVSGEHGGINLIMWYVDRPIYNILGAFVSSGPDNLTLYLFAFSVIVLSSFFYGLCCYAITRIFIASLQ